MKNTIDIKSIDNASKAAARGGLVALSLLILSIGISAFQLSEMRPQVQEMSSNLQSLKAEVKRQKIEIEIQKNEVEHYKEEVERQKADVKRQKIEAEIQKKNIDRQKIDLEKKRAKIISLGLEISALEKQKEGYKTYFNSYKAGRKPMQEIVNSALKSNISIAQVIPRVYIQIVSDGQKDSARLLSNYLEKAGFISPGIEVVGSRSPLETQIRYYSSSSETQQKMNLLLSILKQQGLSAKTVKLSGRARYEELAATKPLQFELWLGKDFK